MTAPSGAANIDRSNKAIGCSSNPSMGDVRTIALGDQLGALPALALSPPLRLGARPTLAALVIVFAKLIIEAVQIHQPLPIYFVPTLVAKMTVSRSLPFLPDWRQERAGMAPIRCRASIEAGAVLARSSWHFPNCFQNTDSCRSGNENCSCNERAPKMKLRESHRCAEHP